MIKLTINLTLYIKGQTNKNLLIFVAEKNIIKYYKYNYTYNTLIKKAHQIADKYCETVYKTGIKFNDSLIQVFASYNSKYLTIFNK